jgi:hypothetical protein
LISASTRADAQLYIAPSVRTSLESFGVAPNYNDHSIGPLPDFRVGVHGGVAAGFTRRNWSFELGVESGLIQRGQPRTVYRDALHATAAIQFGSISSIGTSAIIGVQRAWTRELDVHGPSSWWLVFPLDGYRIGAARSRWQGASVGVRLSGENAGRYQPIFDVFILKERAWRFDVREDPGPRAWQGRHASFGMRAAMRVRL